MNLLKSIPATLFLIVLNILVFIFAFLKAGSLDSPAWNFTLLEMGAEFNPYTLDGQWYRIFTHMFLHGHLLHLGVNMYALFILGLTLERRLGTGKFVGAYFLCGAGAAMTSLYWNIFLIGVGASGAIFGLFGVLLVFSLLETRTSGESVLGLVLNFLFFLGINLIFAKAFRADTAAHLGGLLTGFILGAVTSYFNGRRLVVPYELVFALALVVIFFLLPRHQVNYYKFFTSVLSAERSANENLSMKGLKDEEYIQMLEQNTLQWDSAMMKFQMLEHIPPELSSDTFKLRRYISLRQRENAYKVKMIRDESYIYLDSIEVAEDSIQHFLKLDYALIMEQPKISPTPPPENQNPDPMIKVWYDENWNEIAYPGPYYRIGVRDSLKRWQGLVRDYYANGSVQMKGRYKDDQRDGVFLFYSDHKTYTSAGRFEQNKSVGKWQTFHANGRLEREESYDGMVRLINLWDSTGFQIVNNGYGKLEELYSNGKLALTGEFRNGLKEGFWYGYHENGDVHYMEEYRDGVLVNGRSRKLTGETFLYDQSSFFPQPDGGTRRLNEFLDAAAKKEKSEDPVHVRISFRVTADGRIADVEIQKTGGPEWDARAKEILLRGPRWIPGKIHGYIPADAYAFVDIEF